MKVAPEALAELGEGMRWYDSEERGGRGEDFLAAVEGAFERIEALPLSFPMLRADVRIRRAVVRRFPYLVYFLLLSTGEPRVIAVAHGSRRHMYWADRL